MDLTTLDFIRIAIGVVILLYVVNCLLNQKVWIARHFLGEQKRNIQRYSK